MRGALGGGSTWPLTAHSRRRGQGAAGAMGERLRDGWYQKRLRALYDAGGLYEYELCEQDVWGFQRRKGVGRNELSLLDDVPTGGMRDVRCGGRGA